MTKHSSRVCVLLTDSPAASSQDNCVLAQVDIRNAEKKDFQTAFINIYQTLQLNLGAILLTFQLNNAFAIETSDAVILWICLFDSFICFRVEEILSQIG